jgi:uncharacterized protein (TIGR00661 family)
VLNDEYYINFNANQENIDKTPAKLRILVAPLDWGLGHATRCIPLIKELIGQQCEVWLAGDGATEQLLRKEFPQTKFLFLPGYHTSYPAGSKSFAFKIIRQIPKLRSAISYEHMWLKKQVAAHRFDAVISDNRFGLYHKDIPCIFITHQLTIKSPFGKWSEKIIQYWNYSFINRFKECWVPDLKDEDNFAGLLSHPEKKPKVPLYYTGILSRLKKLNANERKGHLLILLSGPEPQRSVLENKIIDELVKYNGTADIIRGLPASDVVLPSTNHFRFWNHLPTDELNKKMAEAELIISRSGYSTVMDIVRIQKKSILIATPGQTEQLYLAKYLMENRIAYCVQQANFSLQSALKSAENFPFEIRANTDDKLTEIVQRFISEQKI